MSLTDKTVLLCTCNDTMPIDRDALARTLGAQTTALHTAMCQKDLAAFRAHASGDVVVGCTQEQRLLGDVVEASAQVRTVRPARTTTRSAIKPGSTVPNESATPHSSAAVRVPATTACIGVSPPNFTSRPSSLRLVP